jgi:ATP-binding cassette subfamily B protein
MAGRTTILVAHRASTVRLADRVVLLDEGRIVDEGTHDELLVRRADYRALMGDEAEGSVLADEPAGPGGITASAWPELDSASTLIACAAVQSARGVTGAPGGGGFGANLAATPELLAALATLPPANDEPNVDLDAAAAEPPEPFRVMRFVRPWRRALQLGPPRHRRRQRG